MKFTPIIPFSEKCKISTLGTNPIMVKGTHHPRGTNSYVFRKFSPCPPPGLHAFKMILKGHEYEKMLFLPARHFFAGKSN